MKFLVIDDSNIARKRVESVIEMLHPTAEIFCCESGEQGLVEMIKNDPDYIFTDIEMPEMNGHEFIRLAKKYTDVPIYAFASKEHEINGVTGKVSKSRGDQLADLVRELR